MCKLRRIREINVIFDRFASTLTQDVNKYVSEHAVHNILITENNGYSAILITYNED